MPSFGAGGPESFKTDTPLFYLFVIKKLEYYWIVYEPVLSYHVYIKEEQRATKHEKTIDDVQCYNEPRENKTQDWIGIIICLYELIHTLPNLLFSSKCEW